MATPTFSLRDRVMATAYLLVSQGAEVSIIDINTDQLASVLEKLKEISNGGIKEVVRKFGKLDGGVKFPGVIPESIDIERVEHLNDEDCKFVMGVIITGVGSIVNAASVAGLGGLPKNAAYTVSKHGIIGLTKTVAREKSANVFPPSSLIDTEMHRESVRIRGKEGDFQVQMPRKGQPDEVAALISWLLCDVSQYITGTVQNH
ncbi:NAD(P)-binding protein [Lepidopterella palustris CBS 459.81]|uniref:NAD(P)-binding protein n=1 Tax=Lepidopterella palustris CBS 459.81 TaxID=1314670 RepID=A0A8E2J8I4_9PEZI|nr:NAD(P)-binding protein [Lepidopterella palustris CBS 459.81]